MSDIGIKVSKSGYDAKTTIQENLLMNSAKGIAKIFATGTASITLPLNSLSVFLDITADFDWFNGTPVIYAYALINGKYYRTNVTASTGGSYNTDSIGMYCWAVSLYHSNGDGTGYWYWSYRFNLYRTATSSTYPNPLTVSFTYYVMGY